MAVESRLSGTVYPVDGIRLATVSAGIKKAGRLDLVMFELAPGSRTAGVFTRNAFCAAPVIVCRRHLAQQSPRYLLINTGNANAGTGPHGLNDALACCSALAARAGVTPESVLPFSTGVIGQPLPVNKITDAIPVACAALESDGWNLAARGIMTTDTRPKAASVKFDAGDGRTVTITGIAKGAGMIKPDMATMLAFLFTDAELTGDMLQEVLDQAVKCSFNRITVDGDTSTNDSCVLVSTGRSGVVVDAGLRADFSDQLSALMQQLATEIIRDAEGATKFVTINVSGGGNSEECLSVAYAIAESPLVKTALFASDPNWGRILAAIGRAGLDHLDISRISIDLGATPLVRMGALADSYTEADGQAEMDREEITIVVDLARGQARETVWTSDLSHDYVRINAEYRT